MNGERLSPMSKKRATVMFNLPDDGRQIIQERPDVADPHLRAAIQAACATFWREYKKPRKRVPTPLSPCPECPDFAAVLGRIRVYRPEDARRRG